MLQPLTFYGLLAAWTSIYQVKLPAKILFLHVEPSFFLSSRMFSNVLSAYAFALDFRLAERCKMLDDLPRFHASGLRDAKRGRVHFVPELLDHEVLSVH